MMLLLVLLTAAALRQETLANWAPRTYLAARAPGEVRIDGRIDDAEWAGAPWTEPFVDIEGDRRPAPRHETRARMMWDDDRFYIAAQMEEPHLWATLTERDSIIFYDNDFEIFFDPDDDTHLYGEIEINALNTVWDLLLVAPYRDGGPALHEWDIPGLKTAVALDGTLNDPTDVDRGWSVEMAIPWAALRPLLAHAQLEEGWDRPAPGDRWRINFSRVQWRLETDGGGYRKQTNPETGKPLAEDNWVWTPQRAIAMHEPEFWGFVEFAGEPGPAPAITDTDQARWALRQVYYAQRVRHDAHGTYGAGDDLDLQVTPPDGWSWPPEVRLGFDGYDAMLCGPNGAVLIIDETGRTRFQ